MIADTTVIITYDGSMSEFGKSFPRITSRMVPPATPVIVARMIIPTMSALCSIALNATVKAKANVPNRSKMYMKHSIDKDGSGKPITVDSSQS